MTITAKFPGKCRACGGAIHKGDAIEWQKGQGAAHLNCSSSSQRESPAAEEMRAASAIVAPCWKCKDPNGRFRNFGAATPVYCDGCYQREDRKRRGLCPTCGGPMSRAYALKGYQCDGCADLEEFGAPAF